MSVAVQRENRFYRYELERFYGGAYAGWWHTLVIRRTGDALIIIDRKNSKQAAISTFQNMNLVDIARTLVRWGIQPVPMYKPNT